MVLRVNRLLILSLIFVGFSSFVNKIEATSLDRDPDPIEKGDPDINEEKKLSTSDIRLRLKLYASDFLGTRYKYSGTTPKGFDCSGFMHFIFKEYGLDISGSSASLGHKGMRVPILSAQPGDLLFFGVKGKIHHVGMVIKNVDDQLLMIHSSSSRGVVIENVWDSAYWRKRLLFAKDILSGSIFAEDTSEIKTF